jgi:hypothetical protein
MTRLSSLNGTCHGSPVSNPSDLFMILKKKEELLVINYRLVLFLVLFTTFPFLFLIFFLVIFFLYFTNNIITYPISLTPLFLVPSFFFLIFFLLFFFLLNNASLPRIHTNHHHSVSISLLRAVASLSLPACLPFSRSLNHSISVISLSLLVSFCLKLKTESLRSES